MDLYTELSTLSTSMNGFSCGNLDFENKNMFCEKSQENTVEKCIKKRKELKKFYYELQKILKNYIVML